MTLTVDAIYEDGVLKPARPLPLKEHERVEVTIVGATSQPAAAPTATEVTQREPTHAERTAGLMGWTGSAEDADYFALDPELDYPLPGEES